MKLFLTYLFFLINFALCAQQFNLTDTVSALKAKIEQSQNEERLQWMDSLSKVIEFNEDYGYDSLVQETIDFALILGDLNTATQFTSRRIHYKNKILGNPNDGITIYMTFLGKEEPLTNDRIKSEFHYQGGSAYYSLYDLENATTYFKRSKEFALKGNQALLGELSMRLGAIYIETGESGKASSELQTAYKKFREQNDTAGIIEAKNNISILYSQHQFYEEAEKERNEAIALVKEFSGITILSLFYFNAAADYRMMGDQANRIKNIKLALEHNNSEHRDFFEPFFLCDLIIALAENDSLAQAEHYFKRVESDLATYTQGRLRGSYIETLKQLELARGNYEKSILYGKQHLDLKKEGDVYVEIMNAEKFLSDVYKKVNDESNAKIHLLKYYSIKDSITNVQNAKNLSLYQTLYETEKRDYQIEAQQKDIALLNSQNRVKNQWLLFGGLGLISTFGFVFIIRSRNMARREQRLQESFSLNLISAEENERSRLAFELHDSVGQQLMMIKRKSKSLGDDILEALSSNTLENLRSISRSLHPVAIGQLGITAALKDLVTDLKELSDTQFEVDIDDVDATLDKQTALHVYRIFQEVLSNVIKHADAKDVFISLKKDPEILKLSIKDTGKGFDYGDKLKTSKSLGMKSLSERCKIINAKLEIDSVPMQGTEVSIVLPIN